MNKRKRWERRPRVAALKGAPRVSRAQISELLELARSDDPTERREAAQWLCPCHVRQRIETVWEALYRLLEDEDVKVRRQAWHTLEDGGRPDDPALDAIVARTMEREQDSRVLRFAERLARPRRAKEMAMLHVSARPQRRERGKCDFCGRTEVFVERDIETMIPAGAMDRIALICEECAVSVGTTP